MSGLSRWLKQNGFSQLEGLFDDNGVDFAALSILSEADLQELGLSFGMRKRVLAAVKRAAPAAGLVDVQRRHLTVLFCDMVGYTAHAARLDPDVLSCIMQAYEDLCVACVSRHGGYLFQRLGDGIVAFFGYPMVYEREAERAISSALDILQCLKSQPHPLEVRIGISTGVVVVSAGGRAAVGDAMILAARLQAIAEPGTITVSSAVRDFAPAAFRYASRGKVALKGFPEPDSVLGADGPESVPV